MMIERFQLENWLYPNKNVKFNLAESGVPDMSLSKFLEFCEIDLNELSNISLGNENKWGLSKLREEIAKTYSYVDPEEVLVTTSTSEALFCIFNILLKSQDNVVVVKPTFPSLYEVPNSIGCKVIPYDLISRNTSFIEIEELKRIISQRTKMLIINNPNNPTGLVIGKEDLCKILNLAKEKNIYLVLDEHYRFLDHNSKKHPTTSGFDLDIGYDRLISTGSITKCFGVNGLRIGWIICRDRNLLDKFLTLKECLTYATPIISNYLALFSLRKRERFVNYHLNHILTNLRYLQDFVQAYPKYVELMKPQGGAVCFPQLSENIDIKLFCQNLVDKKEISLLPGTVFGCPKNIRMNISYETIDFKEILGEIGEFFDNNSTWCD